MSFFYSPFTDKTGNPVDIFHIQHRHLIQLSSKEIEEGYQVEYKTELTDSVKKKLPKIITSFANSAGGWLFVGVDEKTLELDKLEKPSRTDYSQIISQLLREHVSPLPRFEARFLKSNKSTSGVLVVYVYEGTNPPYVADGTVYVRNGSSSEPAKSQRAEIDVLYQKRNNFEQTLKDFCRREIFYPMDYEDTPQVALCNIYIMNTVKTFAHGSSIRLEDLAQEFMSISPNQFHNYIFSSNSVVFQNNRVLGKFNIGINFEIFSDYSAKLHVPIKQLDSAEKDAAVDRLKYISGQDSIDYFLLLDGYSACQSFQYIVQQYFDFLKAQKVDLSAFIYQMSLEDTENSILYFDSDPYEAYVREHGIPFCCKPSLQSLPVYLKKSKDDGSAFAAIVFLIDFFFMFGLNPMDAANMYVEALKEDPTRNLTIT